MKKFIYLDLDETLISSRGLYHGSPRSSESVIDLGTQQRSDRYASYLRSGALDLITLLKSITPEVRLLTTATLDYALAWNKTFNLGFEPDMIFAREHIHQNLDHPVKKLTSAFLSDSAYLIDNLPRYELGGKIAFIHRHTDIDFERIFTYQIPEFNGRPDEKPEFGALLGADLVDISNFLNYGSDATA